MKEEKGLNSRRRFLKGSSQATFGALLQKLIPVGVTLTALPAQAGQIISNLKNTVSNVFWWGINQGKLGPAPKSTVARGAPINGNFNDIDIGNNHSLALKNNELWVWGTNSSGQLGDGTVTTKNLPQRLGTFSDWQVIGAGDNFSVGLRGAGGSGNLWAWGYNLYGQLGDGTNSGRSSPVQIGTSVYQSVAVGSSHVLAIRSDNTLWAWGSNSNGQLGDTTQLSRSSPVLIGSGWMRVATGPYHALGIKSDRTLWAWGYDSYTGVAARSPNLVGGGFSAIAAGSNYSHFLKSTGLFSSGLNSYGQLGNNTTENKVSMVQTMGPTSWSSIVSGDDHSLGISSGKLFSWGINSYGQLGDGTTLSRSNPVQIGNNNWTKISVGNYHSAAIDSAGSMYTWGYNGSGQLGHGTSVNRSSPVQVGAAGVWINVAAGDSHTIALKNDGTLWGAGSDYILAHTQPTPVQIGALSYSEVAAGGSSAAVIGASGVGLWSWGYNGYGQLGDNTTTNKSSPIQISTSSWSRISMCSNGTLAVKADGTLWSWGSNTYGQLGTSDTTSTSSPVQVGLLSDWSQISFSVNSTFAFAVKTDGTLWGWGNNYLGQLGTSDTTPTSSPVQMGTQLGWSVVSTGAYVTAAIRAGTLWCWGYGGYGQIGNGTLVSRSSPVQVGTLADWTAVSVGQLQTLGIRSGQLWSWGNDSYSTTGLGYSSTSPIRLGSASNWIKVFACNKNSFAINSLGELWGWGENSNYQLSDGTTVNSSTPIKVGTLTGWTDIKAGDSFVVGICNGKAYSWGRYSNGQLGLGAFENIFIELKRIGSGWTDIACGSGHQLGLKSGALWAWGSNYYGQLGDSSTTTQLNPVQIGTNTNWTKVVCGPNHSLARNSAGELWAWGSNNYRQLGDATKINRSSPILLSGTGWTSMATSSSHTLALNASGDVYAWGANSYGQLSLGWSQATPVQISADTDWAEVYCSSSAAIFRKLDGTFWGLGEADNGMFGNGSSSDYDTPTALTLPMDFTSISLGDGHGLGLKATGQVFAWGSGSYGQMGDGNTNGSTWTPIQITNLSGITKILARKNGSIAIK